MPGPTVVQKARAQTGSNSSAAPVFGSPMTPGNTIVAISAGPSANMASFPSVSNSGWTNEGGARDNSSNGEQVEVWTVPATGGSTTPGTIQSGTFNSSRNGVAIWEVTGDIALDALFAGHVAAAGGTTGNLVTVAANVIAMLGICAEFEAPAVTGGGWSADFVGGTDNVIGGNQASLGLGATLNATIGASGFANTGFAMASFATFTPPPPPSSGGLPLRGCS